MIWGMFLQMDYYLRGTQEVLEKWKGDEGGE